MWLHNTDWKCSTTTPSFSITIRWWRKSGVNFINILCTTFTLIDPKSVTNTIKSQVSFYAFEVLGSTSVKAVRWTLMKLTPDWSFLQWKTNFLWIEGLRQSEFILYEQRINFSLYSVMLPQFWNSLCIFFI